MTFSDEKSGGQPLDLALIGNCRTAAPQTGELWGTTSQTYSMAGIVNSAMRLSTKWEDVWCRDLS
jgi:hypothetical protein